MSGFERCPLHASCTLLFFFFFTLVTGARSSWSLKLSDTRVYEPQIRARAKRARHRNMHGVRTGSWTGPPRGGRAPRVSHMGPARRLAVFSRSAICFSSFGHVKNETATNFEGGVVGVLAWCSDARPENLRPHLWKSWCTNVVSDF